MDIGDFLNKFEFLRQNPLHINQLIEGMVIRNGELVIKKEKITDSKGKPVLYVQTLQRTKSMSDNFPYDYFKAVNPEGILEYHYQIPELRKGFFPTFELSALMGPSNSDIFYQMGAWKRMDAVLRNAGL